MRVAGGADNDAVETGRERRAQDIDGVAGTTGHDVVAVVHQDHRLAAGPIRRLARTRDGLRQRFLAEDEFGAARPEKIGAPLGGALRQRRSTTTFGVGHHHHAHAGVWRVGLREAAEHTAGKNAGVALAPLGAVQRRLHGAEVGVHAQGLGQHARVGIADHRFDLAIEHIEQQPAGVLAGFVHVDVRIGLEADDDVGVGHDLAADVAMQVERDGERRGGCEGADALEQVTFAIRAVLGHHRAVQVEEDGVAAARHGRADGVAHVGVGSRLDWRARVGHAGQRGLDLAAARFGQRQEGAHGDARAGHGAARVGAVVGSLAVAGAKSGQRRGHRRKSVGFMLHAGDDYAHDECPVWKGCGLCQERGLARAGRVAR